MNTTTWAADSFERLRRQSPDLSEREVRGKMLDEAFNCTLRYNKREEMLNQLGTSVHGLCYGLAVTATSGITWAQSVQLIHYIDAALEARGYALPTIDLRRGYFRELGLPERMAEEESR